MNTVGTMYSVSPSRARDPEKGHVFETCRAAMAFVEVARNGTRLAVWARKVNEPDWFKMGLIKKTSRGLRVLRSIDGELRPEPEAAEDPPAPLRTWGGGQVPPVAALDCCASDDDP